MLNITNIIPPRVPLVDPATGLISREWYRFFLNMFQLVSDGSNQTSIQDLMIGPPANYEIFYDELNKLRTELNSQILPDLGTMAPQNAENVAITGGVASLNYLDIKTTGFQPSVSYGVGRLWWNPTGTLNLGMGNGNITQQIGEELFIYGQAKEDIVPGQVITRSSGTAQDPSGEKCVRFEPAPIGTSDPSIILGISTEIIAKNSFGRITYFGVVHELGTAGLGDGAPIWYDPTVLGGYTITKPSAPSLKYAVGNILKAAAAPNGSLLVQLVPSTVLGGTDANVQFSGIANGDLIQYYSSGSYWRNVPVASVVTSAATATNLAGGAGGSIPYQSTANTTTFLPIGTTGLPLVSNGTVPAYTALGVVGGGTGTTTSFTQGSVIFAGASGVYSQDNTRFYYDDTNGRLGVGITPSTYRVTFAATANVIRAQSTAGSFSNPQFIVVDNATVETVIASDATNGRADIGTYTAHPLCFRVQNSEKMRIFTTGDVNIGGTAATDGKLEVQAASGSNGYSLSGYGFLKYDGTKELWFGGLASGQWQQIKFGTNGTEKARIDASGVFYKVQNAPTTKSAAATLTQAEVLTGILSYTATAVTITMPTGTAMDTSSNFATNSSIDWSVINTGTGTCTVAMPASGMSSLGALTVAANTSGLFRLRKTAANTFVLYRLS